MYYIFKMYFLSKLFVINAWTILNLIIYSQGFGLNSIRVEMEWEVITPVSLFQNNSCVMSTLLPRVLYYLELYLPFTFAIRSILTIKILYY